ncbi:molybdopterin dinucleotide binding domain-containing protein [Streptomyces sp. NPDC054961]
MITGRGGMGPKSYRRDVAMFNSATATGEALWPERNGVYVNPADADRLGVAAGAQVRLTNDIGSLLCPAELSEDVPAGHAYGERIVAFLRSAFPEAEPSESRTTTSQEPSCQQPPSPPET